MSFSSVVKGELCRISDEKTAAKGPSLQEL